MADLGIQRSADYPTNIQSMWMNFWKFFRKSTQLIRAQMRDLKWKNRRAAPGTAYIPTEIEHIANVATHGIWVIPAIIAGLELVWRAKSSTQLIVAWVYGSALTLLFVVSTVFHSVFYCSRHRQWKDVLHRCDRAMIYVFIAGSYYPWLNLGHSAHPTILNTVQWCTWAFAALGIIYQQMYHERFKCLETFFYVVMGLGPSLIMILCGHEFKAMHELTLGGCLYIIGICFFKADGSIPCAHAIWHVFVILAASIHYYAISKHLFPSNVPIG